MVRTWVATQPAQKDRTDLPTDLPTPHPRQAAAAPAPTPTPAPASPPRGSPWLRPAAWTILGLLLVLEAALLFKDSALVKVAPFAPLNSDHVQNVLEVSDILRGNVLLHGWVLASDNFYLSDNPFFLLTRLLFGNTLLAIYSAPFLIYAVFLSAAAGIVWFGAPDPRARAIGLAALLFFLGTPSLGGIGTVIFVGAQHIAELAFCALAWLALEMAHRAGTRRPPPWLAAFYTLCALVALMSDPLGVVVFLLPTLAGLFLALLLPARRPIHAWLIGLTLAALLGAFLGLALIRAAGGFTMLPNQSLQFVSAAGFGRNAVGVFFGLLWISGAYFFGRALAHLSTLDTLFRFAGLVLVAAATAAALRPRTIGANRSPLRFILALAVLIDVGSCLTSYDFALALVPSALTGGASIRYLTPAVLFGGILAALELPAILGRVKPRGLRWAWTAFCGAALVVAAVTFAAHGVRRWHEKPAIASEPGRIAGEWLLAHGLTHGLGTYWEGLLITALTGQQVTVRAVLAANGRLSPFVWIIDRAWYRNQPRPQFVIYDRRNRFGVTPQTITATYGRPTAIAHVAGYDIALLAAAGK